MGRREALRHRVTRDPGSAITPRLLTAGIASDLVAGTTIANLFNNLGTIGLTVPVLNLPILSSAVSELPVRNPNSATLNVNCWRDPRPIWNETVVEAALA